MSAISERRCIFLGCVATWKHHHGGFPGGHDDPADPEGPPVYFTDPDPEPTAVRDYNGAALPGIDPAFGRAFDEVYRR